MSQKNFALAVRMKEYEAAARTTLPRRLPVILRVDGRAFHTYLRNAERPFDMDFVAVMGEVAIQMCRSIPGAVFGYHQSDEISILVCDYPALDAQPWFGKEVQKLVSISASMATAYFAAYVPADCGLFWRGGKQVPMFDSRVFVLPDAVEVANYFVWRQKDAMRNAVAMVAQSMFTPRQLHGVNVGGMLTLMDAAGVDFEAEYPGSVKYGQYVHRHRSVWQVGPAPLFKAEPGNVLARLIPGTSTFGEGNSDDQ